MLYNLHLALPWIMLAVRSKHEASTDDVGAPAAGDIGIRSRTVSMTVDSFIMYHLGP